MVNTEVRLIIFFAAKDRDTLYSQQKQDWELTVAQIIIIIANSLVLLTIIIAKFRCKLRNRKPLDFSGMT